MVRILLCLLLLLTGWLPAQERRAAVTLEDGQVLSGVVKAMDITSLQLQVGDVVHTLAATRIRSCQFESTAPAAEAPAAPETPATPAAEAGRKPPRIPWTGPLPAPEDPAAAEHVPADLRGRSRWRERIERLDEIYPWLVPAVPTQWISLGLLVLALGSFVVHLSTRVAGVESTSFPRSVCIAGWFQITAALQVALVPINDFTVVLMLLSNTSLALFWLRTLFGMPRASAVIAFAVQLGFGLVAFGLLELVTALLASVGAAG